MNIRRLPSPKGLRSILTYWYRGVRYRPVLGYDLTRDQEQREALQIIKQIHEAGDRPSDGDRITFADFIPIYLKRMKIKGRADIRRNEKLIEQHLVPHFGTIRLKDLRLHHGEDYIEKRQAVMDQEGVRLVADGTIERECAVLSAIMNLAVEHEYIDRNRLRTMPVPQGEKRERVATPAEIGILLKRASPQLRKAIMVAINVGLRQGRIVAIDQTWIKSMDDGPWLYLPAALTRTKGNPKRLPLNRLAADALKMGVAYLHGRRIFDNWASGTSLSHEFSKLCKRCNVEDLTFHDLRHTFTTALKALGVDFEMRELLLGHKLPGLVATYSHDTPDYDRKLRHALDRLANYWGQVPLMVPLAGSASAQSSQVIETTR